MEAKVSRAPINLSGQKRWYTLQPIAGTTGTDTTLVAGTVYYCEVDRGIRDACLLTGIEIFIGGVGGTDKVIVALHDSTGAVVATSNLEGTTFAASGQQRVPFTAPITVRPGTYYISVQSNGIIAKIRTLASGFAGAANVIGVFGTIPTITPPTTFQTGKGPIAATY